MFRVPWINNTSSCTKATILLSPKGWYVEMVSYGPASFVSVEISWKCKPIIYFIGTCLLIDLLFSKVILSINVKKLFSEKSGLKWNNWSLKFMIGGAFYNESINCINVLSPNNTGIGYVGVKYCVLDIS